MENKYYQKHKEILEKETRERYQNRSDKEKEKRQKKRSEIGITIFLKKTKTT